RYRDRTRSDHLVRYHIRLSKNLKTSLKKIFSFYVGFKLASWPPKKECTTKPAFIISVSVPSLITRILVCLTKRRVVVNLIFRDRPQQPLVNNGSACCFKCLFYFTCPLEIPPTSALDQKF